MWWHWWCLEVSVVVANERDDVADVIDIELNILTNI